MQNLLYKFSKADLKNCSDLENEFKECITILEKKGYLNECYCYTKLFDENFLGNVKYDSEKDCMKSFCAKL